MSYWEYMQECWNHANPDEDDRTDEEVEACHTVDDRTHQVVSIYCWGDRAAVVAGDRVFHLSRS